MAADEAIASAQAELERSKNASVRLLESLARKLGRRRGPRPAIGLTPPGGSAQERTSRGAVVAVTIAGVAAGLLVAMFAFRRRG